MQRNDLTAKQKAPLAAIAAVRTFRSRTLWSRPRAPRLSACASSGRRKPSLQAVCAMASDRSGLSIDARKTVEGYLVFYWRAAA
jgi:hypothetical protein